jgi:hypothetical protein
VSEWSWIRTGDYEVAGGLTFARAATPHEVIEAFGLDPSRAVLVPEEQLDQALRYPVFDEQARLIGPFIRTGRYGEWAFAIERIPTHHRGEVGRRLSYRAEAVAMLWTPTINNAWYFVDGEQVTSFQPEMARYRYGSDPDRFVAQMRATGVDLAEHTGEEDVEEESADSEPAEDYADPVLATLDMFTLALGIRLPAEVAEGPLLTVQRPPGS